MVGVKFEKSKIPPPPPIYHTADGKERRNHMSEKEKQAAKEVIDSPKQIPPDGADYVRGYLQGRLDGIKAEKKEDKE